MPSNHDNSKGGKINDPKPAPAPAPVDTPSNHDSSKGQSHINVKKRH